MKKMLKNRKGFTLTELCIVIAISAIVGVMITTTVVLTSTQKEDIQTEAAFIREVTDIQIKVTEWLRKYDNTDYAIEPMTDEDDNTYLAVKELDAKGNVTENVKGTLKFTDGALVEDYTKAIKCRNVKNVVFQIDKGTSDEGGIGASVVKLTVTAQKGVGNETMKQTLLFPLFSAITRNRIVDGEGQWND